MTFFVLGAGASAADLDLPRLRRSGFLLGVNACGLHAECDATISLDKPFISRNAAALVARGPFHVCLENPRLCPDGAVLWHRVSDVPATLARSTLTGGLRGCGNGGVVAMNFFAHKVTKRDRTIVLLGVDLDEANGTWFPSEGRPPRANLAGVRRNFEFCAPWYRENKIRVLNASPVSALDCFPRITREELYAL